MNYTEFSKKIKQKYPGTYDYLDDKTLAQKMVQKYPQYSDVTFDEPQQTPQTGLIQKGWDALAVPEKMSRTGLGMIEELTPNPEPTGNVPLDVIKGTPRVIAGTLKETAPGFVSRGSILTAGALKGYQAARPFLKPVGKALATGAEALSGLEHKTPGVLTEAFENPKVLFGKGLDTARKAYKAAEEAGDVRDVFKQPLTKEELVQKALEYAKDGSLTPQEALEARKSLDAIKKRLSGIGYSETRKLFDGVAKKMFANADAAFKSGIKSEAVRSIFPMNKTGGASAFKTAIGVGVPPTAPLMSPIVQGTAATAAGMADRAVNAVANRAVDFGSLVNALANSPISARSTVGELLDYLRKKGGVIKEGQNLNDNLQ